MLILACVNVTGCDLTGNQMDNLTESLLLCSNNTLQLFFCFFVFILNFVEMQFCSISFIENKKILQTLILTATKTNSAYMVRQFSRKSIDRKFFNNNFEKHLRNNLNYFKFNISGFLTFDLSMFRQ